nr:hypothetical protein [Nostoc sp. ZfuVER08]
MTHSLVQGKNNSGHEGTPQTGSLRDSSVNHALIAMAQAPSVADRARSH